jgi:hypothetical protein
LVSAVRWLDFSEAQQRQIRETLKGFEDKETVDDLGFGTIRDAISNGLFPGTSIIQTRARYFLFIPWIFMEAQRKPAQMLGKAGDMERKLIAALNAHGEDDGVIGKNKGKDLKTLPSAIYWAGLQTFGIFLKKGMTIRLYGRAVTRAHESAAYEGEYSGSDSRYWLDLPSPPERFFKFEEASLDMTREEAEWLAERFISTRQTLTRESLLSELVKKIQNGHAIDLDCFYFWEGEFGDDIDPFLKDLISHAQRFSLFAHGASLIYNAMIVEALRAEIDEPKSNYDYEVELQKWTREADALDLISWCLNIDRFWDCLLDMQVVINPKTKTFVNDLARMMIVHGVQAFSTSSDVRERVKRREIEHKRGQARFNNGARLRAYGGEAGANRMPFRWFLVKRLLADLVDAYEGSPR